MTASRRRRAVLAAVLLALAGCGTDPGPVSAAPPTPVPRPACARVADEVREIEIDPAVHLAVTVLLTGQGPRGVALFPESDGDICQFADLAHRLADLGYRAATFGPWSNPYTRPAIIAHDALRAAGARDVVLIGASQGATVALSAAAGLTPSPAGVISLSAESSAGGTVDALAGAQAFSGPVLLAGTEDDMYAPGGVTRRMAELHPGEEQVLLFEGSDHGIDLLPRTSTAVEDFLERTLPG